MSSSVVYGSRLYADQTDRQAMAQLLFATRPQGRLVDFPSPHDLHEIVAQLSNRYQIRLWEDGAGVLAGMEIVDLSYNNFYFETALNARDSEMEVEMIDWAAGFRIRAAAGEQEAEALTALHRAAFGTEHMTVEERLAMMRVPDYDPALDLLAVAPDGSLAAYCFCCISHEEGTVLGHTDPVATHPCYQRLGLAQALMLTGLRCLQERGAVTAMLGTSSENVAMQRAAESAGFLLAWSKVWLSKPIGPGAGDPKVVP